MSPNEPRRILNWHNRYLLWGGSECLINQAVVAAPFRRTQGMGARPGLPSSRKGVDGLILRL